ncbi:MULTISPECIES: PRC-barrel domain-containing protein [unclassified Frigoribacterium]|uniref:PRC-barrel domain-containing protein n=1 Tax=unclassified Frigoribacterium TaxID=2627005 RepID=UPI0006F8835D|nr:MULTISPECIES: PRC-barrel domain-containing protein [unclassified Frigoribacterium]KQO79608.1 photosystem reaction center subunit H [Frigoribacterium sp. Leaf263]KQR61968.1 photosystem reaction center subunit H [Frigoribacterium sp. Leaf172]
MFEAENLRDWIGLPVVDPNGDKVGTLESIYFDTSTQLATFATVQAGIVGKKLLFVPLQGAVVAPKHLKVQFDKKIVKDAPSIDTDGELEASREPALFEHYGLAYSVGSTGERRLGRR